MIDTLYVIENGESKKVENVESFETHSNGVIVDFQDGESAEFESIWAGE